MFIKEPLLILRVEKLIVKNVLTKHIFMIVIPDLLCYISNWKLSKNNVYKTDYDLGDKVTILDKKLGVTLNTMITQIEETYESGKVTITPTFGNKIPSLLDKIRRHI